MVLCWASDKTGIIGSGGCGAGGGSHTWTWLLPGLIIMHCHVRIAHWETGYIYNIHIISKVDLYFLEKPVCGLKNIFFSSLFENFSRKEQIWLSFLAWMTPTLIICRTYCRVEERHSASYFCWCVVLMDPQRFNPDDVITTFDISRIHDFLHLIAEHQVVQLCCEWPGIDFAVW